MAIQNIIQGILHDDKKKKILIIALVVFFILAGILVFFLTRPSTPSENQLLPDLTSLAPRDSFSTSTLQLAPTIALYADRVAIAPGAPVTVSWVASNATSCSDLAGDPLEIKGSLSATPTEPYTFEITCVGPKGTEIQSITIPVTNAPFITLHASPTAVIPGQPSLISWNTINADRCTDPVGGTLRLSGSTFVSPKKQYTFEIICTGQNGTARKSITVAMAAPLKTTSGLSSSKTTYTAPLQGSTSSSGDSTVVTKRQGSASITLRASALTVKYGDSSTISWSVQNATNCVGSTPTGVLILPGDGETYTLQKGALMPTPPKSLPFSGSLAIKVLSNQKTATLNLRCTAADGTITEKSITVTSEAAPPGFCETVNPTTKLSRFTLDAQADATQVQSGSPAIVSWSTLCALSCIAHADPWGEKIYYADISNIRDYVEGTDYNRYENIHNLLNVPVSINGGIRIYPGSEDPGMQGLITTGDGFGGGTAGSGDAGDGLSNFFKIPLSSATVEIKCTNSGSGYPRTITKSKTVNIAPADCSKGVLGMGCGFW